MSSQTHNTHNTNNIHTTIMGVQISTCNVISTVSILFCGPVLSICLLVLSIIISQMSCGFTLKEFKSPYIETHGIVINNYTTTLENMYQFYNVVMYNNNHICSLERYNGTNVTEGLSELLPNGYNCVIYHDTGSICHTHNVIKKCKKERAISIAIIVLLIPLIPLALILLCVVFAKNFRL